MEELDCLRLENSVSQGVLFDALLIDPNLEGLDENEY